MVPYYFAANTYEGCGHKHRKAKTARKCLDKMFTFGSVYKLISHKPRKVIRLK